VIVGAARVPTPALAVPVPEELKYARAPPAQSSAIANPARAVNFRDAKRWITSSRLRCS